MYSETKSGNVIAKNASIVGARFIINQGSAFIGAAELRGDRNNGRAAISLGRQCVLEDGCKLIPPQKADGTFVPMVLGNNVFVGSGAHVEAAAVGSNVFIGANAKIGAGALLHTGVIVEKNAEVRPHAVVGPMVRVTPQGEFKELMEGELDEIGRLCLLKLKGVNTQ